MEYSIKECSNRLKKFYDEEKRLNNELDSAEENNSDLSYIEKLTNDVEKLIKTKDEFIENIYALAVFEKYSKIKPLLVRIRTQEEVSWEKAFGNTFDSIPKGLRHSLVGLVEDDHGRYIFK
jgi:hypothetical protein